LPPLKAEGGFDKMYGNLRLVRIWVSGDVFAVQKLEMKKGHAMKERLMGFGEFQVEKTSISVKKAVVSALCALMVGSVTAADLTKDEIARLVKADVSVPVRPGGVDGHPYWNLYSIYFMYAPVLKFNEVTYAKTYRADVYTDRFQKLTVDCGDKPRVDLSSVWEKIPANGFVTVRCYGVGDDGRERDLAGERSFLKTAAFTGDYPKAKRSYADTARLIMDFVFDSPYQANFRKTGKPDPKYMKNAYPAKMYQSLINLCLRYGELRPERKAEALSFACLLADYMISLAQKPGTPLEYWVPTYAQGFGHPTAKAYAGQTMTLYPAQAARAIAQVGGALGKSDPERAKRYLDFAEKAAATFLRLQGEDGTWYIRLDEKTGEPAKLVSEGETSSLRLQKGVDLTKNRAAPADMIAMFDVLFDLTGKEIYRAASDKALKFLMRTDGPMETYNWEGQYEDGPPTPPYRNLTKHPPCGLAIYLLTRFPEDKKLVAAAREMLRFSEDQFVVWEKPMRTDGEIMTKATCPQLNRDWNWRIASVPEWTVPGALEQYDCYNPIDASNTKLLLTYLAFWQLEKKPLDLAKARAMADAIVNMTPDNGDLPTHWMGRVSKGQENWTNCQIGAAMGLLKLSDALGTVKLAAPLKTN